MTTVNANHAQMLASGLSRLQPLLDTATARISSGERIDRPARDVSGNGHAKKLDGEQARLQGAEVNLQNGVSRLQVATDHLRVLNRVVTRIAELTTLSNNPTQDPASRALYTTEVKSLQDQLRQTIGGSTAEIGGTVNIDRPLGVFNGGDLFGADGGGTLAVGVHTDEQVALPVTNLRQGFLQEIIRQDGAGNYTFDFTAPGATATLNGAIDQLGGNLAQVGAVQSRLELAAEKVTVSRTNTEAALSGIRDLDIATETTTLARLQILSEGYTAMLAQAKESNAKLLPLLARR